MTSAQSRGRHNRRNSDVGVMRMIFAGLHITAVAKANKHTVVVLNTSSAVLMPWLNHVDGVLEVWYRGKEYGTALAHVPVRRRQPLRQAPAHLAGLQPAGPRR